MEESHTDNGATDERREPGSRRRSPLGRVLGDSFNELNVLRLLPEVTSHLRQISRFTETMASEVRGMHAAVVRLEHEVQGLREQVGALDGRMQAVEQGMGRLEPHIADVSLVMRPLRRARARLPQKPATVASEPPVA